MNGRGRGRLASLLFRVSVAAALLPIAVAAIRGISRHWLPIGDEALFTIRARDVFSRHPPLVGFWSSASLSAGTNVNNPGPLLFDLLAVPVRLFGGSAGLVVGAALVNGLAVVGVAVVAVRRGGLLAGTVAAALAGALCWSMGSELLFDPWQPHVLLLPFLWFLMLIWASSGGDLVALPWAAAVGSLVFQSHLSYALLVPVLGGWGVVGLGLELRRRRRDEPGSWPTLSRRARVVAAVTALVLVACWVQPVVEQFTSDGQGNLARLARSTLHPTEVVGPRFGPRIVATVLTRPPWWARPSFGHAWSSTVPGPVEPDTAGLPSLGFAVVSLLVVAGLLGACGRAAHRRGDRSTMAAVVTAAVASAVGLLTAVRAPLSAVFGIAPHQFRWLWPLAAFVSFVVIVVVFDARLRAPVRPKLVGAFAVAAAVVAGLNLPTSNPQVGPRADDWAIPPTRDLDRQLGALRREGPLLFDVSGLRFADPYSAALMAELQRRGIPFVVDDPVLVRQLGPRRRFTGRNARGVVFLGTGDATRVPPPGARLVARHEPLTAADRRELSDLEATITRYLSRPGRLRLNRRGRVALRRGVLPSLSRRASDPGLQPEALLRSGELAVMVRAHLVTVDSEWTGRLARYAELQRRASDETVALFLRARPR